MLLFQKRFHAGLVDGSVTLTFRRWQRAHVKPGGRYRCHPIGVLVVNRVDVVRLEQISADDAAKAGFATRADLLAYMEDREGDVFRVELQHGGDGDRVEIALDAELAREDLDLLDAKLARLDGDDPWARKTMRLIAKHPRTAASRLAEKLGRETLPFKIDVRKLKKLGLTQSFEVGYELSPRGRAFLSARPRARKRS